MISLARFAFSSAISFLKNGPSTRKAFLLAALVACTCAHWQIAAAQTRTPTSTTLVLTSGTSTSPVSTVSSGSVVTLTATVTAGSTPLTVGQVSFCDASAKACTDIHLLGMAQLTKAGTAVMKFRPGPGSHQYKAAFAGTNGHASSVSAAANLAVTGPVPSTSTLTVGGSEGNYDLSATVYGTGSAAPGGNVSFLDTSNANAVLATAPLTANPGALNLVSQPNSPGTDFSPFGLAVADFNGDGIEDFAVTSGGLSGQTPTLSILLGKQDGTYANAYTYAATGTFSNVIGTGDFNGDGILDIATADSANNLTVLLGKGDGTFTALKPNPGLGSPLSAAVGDFNSDGILDLAVPNSGSNEITLLLGNGDGTFKPAATSVHTGSGPYSIATADFNQDGIPDLAVLYNNNGQNTLAIYLGNGAGGFTPVNAGPGTGTAANLFSVCDVNGDGVPDLVVVNWVITNPGISQTTAITVSGLIGIGNGTFNAGSQISFDSPINGVPDHIMVADFNGDGNPDLAITTQSAPGFIVPSEDITILLGDGSGAFTNPGISVPAGSKEGGVPVAVGDLNGDGISDLASIQAICLGSCQGSINILVASDQSASATANGVWLPVATDSAFTVASYEGDSHFQPSISASVPLFSGSGTPTVTAKASPNPVPYGVAETLTAQVSGTGAMPTGIVAFYDGSGQLGVGTLSGGTATYTSSSFSVGPHAISAVYAGDTNYTAGKSAVLALTVQKGLPAIAIALSSSSILNTQALTAAITVSGAAGNPIPQGTVAASGGAYTSSASTLSNTGTATISIPAGSLAVGNDTLTVTYTPSSASAGSYTSATQSASVTVVQIGSAAATVTVTPSAAEITDQQNTNVNVTVAGGQGAATPTGSIVLASGGYSAQMALSSGAASFAIPAGTLSAGADTLTATYSGDATYAAASATATVTVSPVVMGATTPSPVLPGSKATSTVTLTAGSSYSGTLNLTCALTKSPANAQSPPTCALNPATGTLAAGGNATTTMTVNTTAGTSPMASKEPFWRSGSGALTFAALVFIGLGIRRRRWLSLLALLVTAICVVSGGCGGSHSTPPPTTPATTAGTYVFTVKAADSKNAAITPSADVSITVQ